MKEVKIHFEKLKLNVSTEWLNACIDHCLSQGQNGATMSKDDLVQNCFDQWLTSDLRTPNLQRSDRQSIKDDNSYFTCQVVSALDIGSAAYSQMVKLNRMSLTSMENATVSADSEEVTFRAAWQPKGGRMLKMVLTNGTETVSAVEKRPLTAFFKGVPEPGAKMTLKGPFEMRKGVLMLTGANVHKIHGGFVEEMSEEFGVKSQLKVKLDNPQSDSSSGARNQRKYQAKGIPVQYKANRKVANKATTKGPLKEKVILQDDAFDDGDDAFLLEAVESQSGGESNVLSTDEDYLFSQIPDSIVEPVQSKRRRI